MSTPLRKARERRAEREGVQLSNDHLAAMAREMGRSEDELRGFIASVQANVQAETEKAKISAKQDEMVDGYEETPDEPDPNVHTPGAKFTTEDGHVVTQVAIDEKLHASLAEAGEQELKESTAGRALLGDRTPPPAGPGRNTVARLEPSPSTSASSVTPPPAPPGPNTIAKPEVVLPDGSKITVPSGDDQNKTR